MLEIFQEHKILQSEVLEIFREHKILQSEVLEIFREHKIPQSEVLEIFWEHKIPQSEALKIFWKHKIPRTIVQKKFRRYYIPEFWCPQFPTGHKSTEYTSGNIHHSHILLNIHSAKLRRLASPSEKESPFVFLLVLLLLFRLVMFFFPWLLTVFGRSLNKAG